MNLSGKRIIEFPTLLVTLAHPDNEKLYPASEAVGPAKINEPTSDESDEEEVQEPIPAIKSEAQPEEKARISLEDGSCEDEDDDMTRLWPGQSS